MKNTCAKCKDTWHVNMTYARLDNADKANIKIHGQLYSICEDCHCDNECVSVQIDNDCLIKMSSKMNKMRY